LFARKLLAQTEMRINQRPHKRRYSSFRLLLISGLSIAFLSILLLSYGSQLPILQERFNRSHTNVNLLLSYDLFTNLRPSFRLKIDGKVVYEKDSIQNVNSDSFKTHLKKGVHQIVVSSKEGDYLCKGSITIEDPLIQQTLHINFTHSPPYSVFRLNMLEFLYQRRIKDKDLSDSQKAQILKVLEESDFLPLEKSDYHEKPPQFTIEERAKMLL